MLRTIKLILHFFLASFLIPSIIYLSNDDKIIDGMLFYSNFSLISGFIESSLLIKRRHDQKYEFELLILIFISTIVSSFLFFHLIHDWLQILLLLVVLLRILSLKMFYEIHINDIIKNRVTESLFFINLSKLIFIFSLFYLKKLTITTLTINLFLFYFIEFIVLYKSHKILFFQYKFSFKNLSYFLNHFVLYSLLSFSFFIYYRNKLFIYDKSIIKNLVFATSIFGIFSVLLNVFISKNTISLKKILYQKKVFNIISFFTLFILLLLVICSKFLTNSKLNYSFYLFLSILICNLPNSIHFLMLPLNQLFSELLYLFITVFLLYIALNFSFSGAKDFFLILILYHHLQGIILSMRIKHFFGISYNVAIIMFFYIYLLIF